MEKIQFFINKKISFIISLFLLNLRNFNNKNLILCGELNNKINQKQEKKLNFLVGEL